MNTYKEHVRKLNFASQRVFNYENDYLIFNDVFHNNNFENPDNNPIKYDILGLYHVYICKEHIIGIQYFIKAIELNNTTAMINLGKYYENNDNYDEMKQYYLMAITQNDTNGMVKLGDYYQYVEQNYEKMYQFYLMAIELNDVNALIALGLHYDDNEEYDKMKPYYLQAIELNDNRAMYNLGWHYENIEENYDEMEKYYLMASERNNVFSMDHLAKYYKKIGTTQNKMHNYDLSVKYYKMVIKLHKYNKQLIDKHVLDYINNFDCSYYEKYQLIKKYEVLHVAKEYNVYHVKLLRTQQFNKREPCLICLEDNVLCIEMTCGHPVCITCYAPEMLCYYRCQNNS